jgi:hypothetical protein
LAAKIDPNGIHQVIRATDTFAIDTAIPSNGSLVFTGVLPTTIYLKGD